MLAAVMTAFGRLEELDLVVDEPAPDEVLVKVAAAGLCHSDVTQLHGRMPGVAGAPKVLGHEMAGVVEKVGSEVVDFAPGDLVTGCNSRYCGHCRQCLEGMTSLCSNRTSIVRNGPRLSLQDGTPVAQTGQLGGFGEYALVGADTLVKLPEGFPLDRAALLGCAVMTGAGSVMNAARVKPGSTVAVFGCGGVGLNAIQAAALCGARQIFAIDLNEDKLDLARTFGATHALLANDSTLVEQILTLTDGGVDSAFECVGLAAVAADALRITAPGHTVYLVGVPGVGTQYEFPGSETVLNGKGLQGVLMGANNFKRDIPILADLYLQGRFKLDELVGERIELRDLRAAMDRMNSSTVARTVVIF